MKPILLAFFGTLTLACADQFQIREANGNAKTDLGYAAVKVMGPQGNVLFEGRTDKYGRISINKLQNKTYEAVVTFGSRTAKVDLPVTGDNTRLKEALIK